MTTHNRIIKEKPGADHAAATRRANAKEAKELRKKLDAMTRENMRLADRQENTLAKMRKELEKTQARFDREYDRHIAALEKEEARIERRLAILEGRGV